MADFSANLHHQLLQLENQFLVASGNSHPWTPNTISLSPSSDFEPNFSVQELNPGAIDAQSFTSLQHYYNYSHGGDLKKDEEKETASFSETNSFNSHHPHLHHNHNHNHNYYSTCFEDFNKSSQSCCCTKIHPTPQLSSTRKPPPLMTEFSNSFGFDHSLSFASSHHLFHPSTNSSLLTKEMPNHEITRAANSGCTLMQQKPTQGTPKKTRVEPRATCPPLKIRKEKLGDRIAALQQLVAPFGKTDTASVLMEAISYINFLQNQVEMLSHSYMKSCRSKNYKTICRDELNEKDKKPESDLKAKGLCLVPLSCISYLPEDTSNGGRICSIWPPLAAAASFNRRTF